MAKAKAESRRSCWFPVLVVTVLVSCSSCLEASSADAQVAAPNAEAGYSRVIAGEITLSPSDLAVSQQTSASGGGLTIVPTFDASIDAATQTVINNALAFYQSTFSNNLTVN